MGDREVWFVLTSGGLEQDLFNELLMAISTQRAFLYIYIYIKKVSSHCCLTYLYPLPPPTNNKNQHRRKES